MPVYTQVLKPEELVFAVERLRAGHPIVFPTETVYGLGAPIFLEDAVQLIYKIKGRPSDNPLIAHVSDLKGALALSEDLPPLFYRLAEAFWPGPLTLVVRRSSRVPDAVSAGLATIAIRMPKHPVARRLIQEVGQPLVAPSANLSGRPSPTSIQDVLEDLDGLVPFVIDGGECEVGIESTVLSLCSEKPLLLRPGSICREALEETLSCRVDLANSSTPIQSPGMKYRHYAPKASVRLVYDRSQLKDPYIIPTAKTLYAQLRKADRLGWERIDIFCDAAVQSNAALMNRLLRAAGQIA